MRNENEVIEQILNFAKQEIDVRIVMLNGSRLNSNAPKDIMQDYDVIFFLKNLQKLRFKTNHDWINQFGELVIFQQNDFDDSSYIFLMQFKDGIRIDLRFCDIKKIDDIAQSDTLSKILLDKDNIAPILSLPNDSLYYINKPSRKEFDKLLNELWWIQIYVAKAVWRDELPLAKYMFDVILMNCMITLLSWQIGLRYDWNVNIGKHGKWLKTFLSENLYARLITLYPTVDYEEIWQSLSNFGNFVRKIGTEVAEKLGYKYPIQEV